eukprot:6800007-Alexandrium_andersonii.AAC.1
MACSPCLSSLLQPEHGTARQTPGNIVPKPSHPVPHAPSDPAIVYLLNNFMFTPEEPPNVRGRVKIEPTPNQVPSHSRHFRVSPPS